MLIPANRLLLWTVLLFPVMALAAFDPLLQQVGGGLGVLLVLAAAGDAVAAGGRRQRMQVVLPDVVRLMRAAGGRIPVIIRGTGRRPDVLRIGLPLPGWLGSRQESLEVATTAAAEEFVSHWECQPQARGRVAVERCYFEHSSPLGFWRVRRASVCRSEIRVYPNLMADRRQLAAYFLRRANEGLHLRRLIGHGREFEKLRDYVPGDDFADIHWKATARRAHPVTKLYQVERTQDIYLALDVARLSGREHGGEPAIERYITAGLTLALLAQKQGDRVGVLAFSDRVNRFVRAGGGRGHFGVCRDALYMLQPALVSPDYEELWSFLRLRVRRRALVIVLTDLSDAVIAEDFVKGADRVAGRHVVVTVGLRLPQSAPLFEGAPARSVDDLYERLGGHTVWQRERELERSLRHRGILYAVTDPRDLASELLKRYLEVKGRQLL